MPAYRTSVRWGLLAPILAAMACGEGTVGAPADPCAKAACDPHATCHVSGSEAVCLCGEGFSGDGRTCAPVVDPCSVAAVCSPDATCSSASGAAVCTCLPGYFGDGRVCTFPSSCLEAATGGFEGASLAVQRGVFEVEWDATPSAAGTAGGVGLSHGIASGGWTELAAIVTFSAEGAIQARDGGAYRAASALSFTPQTTYRLRARVDVPHHRYDVFVTPQGGAEVALAQDYAFRTEQQAVADLDHWGVRVDAGGLRACLVAVRPVDPCSLPGACGDHATCNSATGAAVCTCVSGYTGDGHTCVSTSDPCAGANVCDPNASCSSATGAAVCTCNAGYTGDGHTCTPVADPCSAANACDPNATCSSVTGSAVCTCRAGYAGDGRTCTPLPGSTCATEPMRVTGNKYYFCDCGAGADPACLPGDDSWDGASPSTPRRTGFKERFKSMAAGETVALCRGGAFANDGNSHHNANCRVDSTCDMRDYEDPRFAVGQGEKRPILLGGRAGLFYADRGANQGFRFFNLQVVGSLTGQGAFMGYAGTTDVDICNVFVRDGDLAVYWAEPPPERWTVRQSQFAGLGMGILGGCTDCALDGNYFANTSHTVDNIRDHNVYISGGNVHRMRVSNNELHSCPPGVVTGTVPLVVHGYHEDLLIENNLVVCDNPSTVSPNQWGISVGHGNYTSDAPSYFRRLVVRRNRVIDNGEYGIEISQSPDAVIEDNLVVMPARAGYSGIVLGYGTARPQDDVQERVTVRNNSIYFPAGGGGTGIGSRNEGTGHVIANNVVYYGGAAGQCFDLALPSGAYALLTNNACNGTWGTTYDSSRVALTGSPFVSAGTDFTPAEGSPLVDGSSTASFSASAIGTVQWSPADLGKARDAQPDIGAFER